MNINGYTLACPIEILPPRGKKTISLDGHIILVIVCDFEIYAVLEITRKMPTASRTVRYSMGF